MVLIWVGSLAAAIIPALLSVFLGSYWPGVAAGAVLGGGLAIIISRKFFKPLEEVEVVLAEMADGNLLVSLDHLQNTSVDKLVNALEKLLAYLRKTAKQLQMNSEQTSQAAGQLSRMVDEASKASEQIASATEKIVYGTDTQKQQISDVSAAITEMSAGIGEIAANAKRVSESAVKTGGYVEKGSKAIERAVLQMHNINQTADEMEKVLKDLNAATEKIGQIVDMINNIAGQTNLLALNAAIEAARAGEQGRGFAVVADEVRKLAEQSSRATDQIAELIEEVNAKVAHTITAKNHSAKEVAQGMEIINEAGESFRAIEDAAKNVITRIQEISASTQEIAAGSNQVVSSVEGIKTVSEASTADIQNIMAAIEEQTVSIQHAAQASDKLAKMAEELHHTVVDFGGLQKLGKKYAGRIEEGKRILREITAGKHSDYEQVLIQTVKKHSFFELLYLIDVQGNIKCSSSPLPPINVTFRPWFQAAIKGEEYVSEVYISASGQDRPVITISLPVYENNTIVGVLGGDLIIG